MSDTSYVKHVKSAKKNHRCEWCWEIIKSGESYDWWFDFENKDMVKMHPECLAASNEYAKEDWTGELPPPGTFERGKYE